MIHEILPHHFNNQFIDAKHIHEEDYVLHYQENTILLKTNGDEFELPRKKDFPYLSDTIERSFLFKLNHVSCFLIWNHGEINESKFIYKEINFFRAFKQKEIAWICIVGFQIMNWYTQNQYCGRCGSKTERKTNERSIVCNPCGTSIYPKISPAIIVAIICNDKILLASNSNFTSNWYSLVAGYVDIGESLEETVIREVKEEVGLDVFNIRYYKSQPWPYSGSMMIGFIAEADDSQTIQIDNKEITDAQWYTRDKLPNHPGNISIAGEMIELFEKGEI